MLFTRKDIEAREQTILAPYAVQSAASEGRFFEEKEDNYRTCFQRDRDRVIHSKAFRRLKGKTQVFVAHHGDHFRSRLTHTMEVAQLSRDIARTLGLNEDLAETIALAHDLGHTPFGHAGQDTLNKKMKAFGENFEHNIQSVKIVTELEKRNRPFPGLNLSKEVIIGMGKHDVESGKESGALPYLEAQAVNLADEIAYIHHDLDDGLQSGILKKEDLKEFTLWRNTNSIGELMSSIIEDIYAETEKNIQAESIQSLEDIQNCKRKIVRLSSEIFKQKEELRVFLHQKFYQEQSVVAMNAQGQHIIASLFDYFIRSPERLPKRFQYGKNIHHGVRDYIAGMTDSYAENMYDIIQE